MANVKTLRDIISNPDTRMSPSEMRAAYGVSGIFTDADGNTVARNIEKVTINGNVFTDYSAFSFLWEKSYVSSPVRSGDGSIGNLNSYTTFLTPHLKIDFGLMSIDSYRKLMQLIYTSNEFLVTCYDIVNNKNTTNKMYFSTEEMPKLWTIVDALNGDETAVMLLGVQDYTVEMIGTNADVDRITVNYYLNSPTGVGTTTPIYSDDTVYVGGEIVLGAGSNIEGYNSQFDGFEFDGKWRLGSPDGTLYTHEREFDISKSVIDEGSNSINFYAVWRPTNTYTLTYSYGIGAPQTEGGKQKYSKSIKYGELVGTLPNSPTPTVTYKGQTYSPYQRMGWYKSSSRAIDSEEILPTTPYWAQESVIIYQHFEPLKYTVQYFVGDTLYSYDNVKYGNPIPLPWLWEVYYGGFSGFKGWSFEKGGSLIPENTTMPPINIQLYAVFEE